MMQKQINFIRQQGFDTPKAQACSPLYRALQFQPRVIGLIMIAGVILRSPSLFLALSAVLGWSALMPKHSPFDWVYNRFIAARRARPSLPPAPGPRRFAQGLASALAAIIAWSLLTGREVVAAAAAAILFAAIGAILLGGFCFGSFVFHLLRGQAAFAKRTLPWSRGA